MKHVLSRFPQLVAAFALAVFAAAASGSMFAAAILACKNPPGCKPEGLRELLDSIWNLFLIIAPSAALYVFILSIPVIAVTALLTEWRGWRSVSIYLGAGAAASLPMAADLFNDPDAPPVLALASVCAGLAGGFAYWGIAGRNAGQFEK